MSIESSQVLIVDDSRIIRRAAVKILDKDYHVVEAEDGDDEEKLQDILPAMDTIMGGGLITLEKARVVMYRAEP